MRDVARIARWVAPLGVAPLGVAALGVAALGVAALGLAAVSAAAAPAGPSLLESVKSGNTSAVRVLVKQKVDVNSAEADGTTALHWAVNRDDLETIDLLLAAGANPRLANRY